MRTTDRPERLKHQAVQQLAARLDGSTIKRSVIIEVLAALGATERVRHDVESALREAHIRVVEDVAAPPPAHVPLVPRRAPAPPPAPSDPVAAARARLASDHLVHPRRLAKIILTAEEEVGLTLLFRPDGAPLESGWFAVLQGEARLAADAMLLHNMGLIHSVAQRRTAEGMTYDDLVASAIPGLVRAIELFDPYRGLKFSTYAVQWIRQSIGRAIDDEARLVRLPVHVCESIRKVSSARDRLTVDGRRPHPAHIARECDLTVEKVLELLALAPAVMSLESPIGNDGFTLGDLVDQPQPQEADVRVGGLYSEDVEPLLDCLSAREAEVLRRRHGLSPYDEPATLDVIGTAMGVTRERIRQIEKKALDRLRALLGPDPAAR